MSAKRSHLHPAQAVHRFWFGPIADGVSVEDRNKLWFAGGARVDREIRERFGDRVDKALGGGLKYWERDIRRTLSLVLLLDQFPRNIYRGTARAFAGDARARRLVLRNLDKGRDRELAFIERAFFYMPLEHSEELADHDRCVELFRTLVDEVPKKHRGVFQSSLQYAESHREIIRRFGRYPHRNDVLGRTSTPEENDYLESGAERFGQ